MHYYSVIRRKPIYEPQEQPQNSVLLWKKTCACCPTTSSSGQRQKLVSMLKLFWHRETFRKLIINTLSKNSIFLNTFK